MKTLAILLSVMVSCGFLPPRVKEVPNRTGLEPIVEEEISEDEYVEEITDRIGEETGLQPGEGIVDDGFVEETTDRISYPDEAVTGESTDDAYIEEVTDRIDEQTGFLPVIAIYIPEEERTGLEPIVEEEIPDDTFVEETRDFF